MKTRFTFHPHQEFPVWWGRRRDAEINLYGVRSRAEQECLAKENLEARRAKESPELF